MEQEVRAGLACQPVRALRGTTAAVPSTRQPTLDLGQLEVFKITRLDKLLDIRKTEADAMTAFGPPKKSWSGK